MRIRNSNKIKIPKRDRLLRVFAIILLTFSAICLLFPVYWMLTSATKDEATLATSTSADFSITIRDEYNFAVETKDEDFYEYEDFKRDSTMMIWAVFGKYRSNNIGHLTVSWVNEGYLKAKTNLKELDFRINYVNIFPGEIIPATIEKNIEDIYAVMNSLNSFKKDLNEKIEVKKNTNKLSSELVTYINGLTITSRSGGSRPAFDIENICTGCEQTSYWLGLFDNYIYAFRYFEIKEGVSLWLIFLNTLIISVVAVLFQWVFSAAAAFAVSKIVNKRLGNIITVVFIITMMIPSIVYIVPLYRITAENNLLNNLLTVIIPGIPNATAFLLFKGYFSALPDDLYEASKIDGANAFHTYFKVYLPLALPMFGVIALLVFLGNWNDLLWPSMILKETSSQTFSIVINRLLGTVSTGTGAGYPVTLALSALSMVPTIVVFLIFEKQLVKGVAFSGLKG